VIRGETIKPAASPVKLLLWVAFLGLIFGVIEAGKPVEDFLRTNRNSFHQHKASGDIVIVAVDDLSLKQVGRWPWPRSTQARLTERLTEAGAKRIFFDVLFDSPTSSQSDKAFAEAIRKSERVVLAARVRSGLMDGVVHKSRPLPDFARNARIGSVSVEYDYSNTTWQLPYSSSATGKPMPSFAAMLANRTGKPGTTFLIDYSLDPSSIPAISAAAILDPTSDITGLRGKDVIIGTTSDALNDISFVPGWGRMGAVYLHVLGAETLKQGTPLDLGWSPGFLLAMMLAALATVLRRAWAQGSSLAAGAGIFLIAPTFLEARLIFADVAPALFVLLLVSGLLISRRLRARGLVNSTTGLPNLAALHSNRSGRNSAIIVARILNYAEITASLPANSERELVDQIVARLTLGAPERMMYQGDGGTFAWFENPKHPFGNHLDAVYALFRNPARVADQQLDLAISFGVEVGSSRSLPNRLASAIVAAEQAATDGLRWKYHDPDTLQDASWKLSMMSQLDSAIDTGQVWVAFQPQLELATGQIIGCEALARWTHPDKGPIAAMEFVTAAEQHDRIGKLTDFVFDKALAAGAQLNRKSPGFLMSVNLSAKLLNDQGLRLRIAAALARHGFPASQLIVELTETAELGSNGAAIDMLGSIRDLGATISIDDYGTGLSTLEYLKKVPATEIKIDQSFIMALLESRSDRLMVESTIALAHSLGRRVVAEGVQQRDVLEVLQAMNCDVAQGFIIGRPMSLDFLLKRISGKRRTNVA
jgi:EAL domain-containing protein (putative c-di-GMP-specific phosphodiesterase class I)/CHASE2 domain-containing sensor protein